jgi:pimeloyl-ACP methyl ester carboxylesterase
VNATDQRSEHPGGKPTIVLVHGAFADASSWNGVIERLQQRGYTVIAPANPLRGVTADSAYIASLLNQIDGPVLLVGHSYGGAVITNAAASAPNVAGLVFVAAFAPDEGENLGDLSAARRTASSTRPWSSTTIRPDRVGRPRSSSRSTPPRPRRPSPATCPTTRSR